ncbi:MAG: hypothetical protein WDM88_11670 [Galbitalea sp.]
MDYVPFERAVPVADLRLELTAEPNWGYQLRRGLIPLSDADLRIILHAASSPR